MAQAGRLFPVNMLRDWNPPSFMGRDRLPWRYKFVGGIPRPGPFNGWAGKTVIGSEPDTNFSAKTIIWSFTAPPGADPTTSIKVEYKLSNPTTWFRFRVRYYIGGVLAVTGFGNLVGTGMGQVFGPVEDGIFVPPWPINVPWIGPSGDFRAATWSDLGVTEYPGRWPL